MNGDVFADAEPMNKRTTTPKLSGDYGIDSMAERLVGHFWAGERKKPNAYEYLGIVNEEDQIHGFRFYKI